MILYSIPSDAWDSGNSLTCFREYVCECDNCGDQFSSNDETDVYLCYDCLEKLSDEDNEPTIEGTLIPEEL